MKKIISAIFATMCLVAFQAPAQSVDVSFSVVGLAGNQGGYHARGTETMLRLQDQNWKQVASTRSWCV